MTITRTWVATDACGNSNTCAQTIVVEDSAAPIISCPMDVTIQCSGSTDPMSTGNATASDNCDISPLVTFSDVTAGGTCPQGVAITRTWVATDAVSYTHLIRLYAFRVCHYCQVNPF